jgi:hypothetical protein
MVSIEIIALILTGLSITASIVYYANILKNANKTQQQQLEIRQAQLFMQIHSKWSDIAYKTEARQLFMQIHSKWSDIAYKTEARKLLHWEFTDVDDYLEIYTGPDNLEYEGSITAINTYLEGVAVLMDRKLIDASMVDELMSGYVIQYWEKFRPKMMELRKRHNYPHLSEWVEYLYNAIKEITVKQHPELEKDSIHSKPTFI